MCFPVLIPIAMAAVTALGAVVSQKMQIDGANSAAVANYNNAARYAEKVNAQAILQQNETDARNRTETRRQAETAADRARAQILENRRAMASARASAGTSGMMGLPLNMIEQNYQALIGNIGTNLESTNQQLDENSFFNSMDSMLRAQNITNQAIPAKPHLQKFGMMNVLSAGLQGLSAGLGAMGGMGGGGSSGGGFTPQANNFNPSSFNSAVPSGNTMVYSNL